LSGDSKMKIMMQLVLILYGDEQIIINVSVWESVERLQHYVYKTFHTDFLKRRKEWFRSYGKVHTAMWWIPAGANPTIKEAIDKLDQLQQKGASREVFDFKNVFPMPSK